MSWRACILGEVVRFQRGHDLPDQERKLGDVPVVGSAGLTGWHNEAIAKGPGVSMGRSGASIGRVTYTPTDYWPHNACLYVTDFLGNCPLFVYYYLRTRDFTSLNSGSAQPSLNRNFVHALPARIPGSKVQKRIVEVLSAYDNLIENNRRRVALLEQAARLLYREWFVHLRFPGHEHIKIVDGLPKGWMRRPLRTCATFQSGGTPSKSKPEFWAGDIPWISSGELTSMRISSSRYHVTHEAVGSGSRYAEKGTVLGVVRGMSLAKEFRVGIATRRVCFNQDLKAFVPDREIEPLYLFHALDEQKEQIRQRAGEASHGTKKLETTVLQSLPIPVAAPVLRGHFVEYASPLHEQMDVLIEQNNKLKQARDLLLPRLMSGEIAA